MVPAESCQSGAAFYLLESTSAIIEPFITTQYWSQRGKERDPLMEAERGGGRVGGRNKSSVVTGHRALMWGMFRGGGGN